MNTQKNLDATQAFIEHINNARLEEALEMFSDTVEWENQTPDNVPFGGIYKGKEGFTRYVQEIFASLELGKLGIDDVVAQNDTVVVVGSESSLVKSTGRRYTMSYVFVFKFADDGKILRVREYVDTAALSAAF